MTNEIIAKFCETQKISSGSCVRIDFKKRNSILGLIIAAGDYDDLKSKNFWRIVVRANMETWQRTKNVEIAKIYNGSEFTKLSVVSKKEMV
ncbi:MAG: short-chain dehydrogenase [Panacibacter sp.]